MSSVDEFLGMKEVTPLDESLKYFMLYNEELCGASKILEPIPKRSNDNCHGFSVNGKPSGAYPSEVIALFKESSPSFTVAVFCKGKKIYHSGRVAGGGRLVHYLIGVGIVESPISALSKGHDATFILPDDIEALQLLIEPEPKYAKKYLDKFEQILESMSLNLLYYLDELGNEKYQAQEEAKDENATEEAKNKFSEIDSKYDALSSLYNDINNMKYKIEDDEDFDEEEGNSNIEKFMKRYAEFGDLPEL